MDQQKQIAPEQFQAQCQAFVKRMAGTLSKEDTLGIAVNGALHFAGFLLAQHINFEAANRPVDFQEEMTVAAGVLVNATAHNLHNLQTTQVGTASAANDALIKH